jgi:hypothetical protein
MFTKIYNTRTSSYPILYITKYVVNRGGEWFVKLLDVVVMMILTPLDHLPLLLAQLPFDHCPYLDLDLCLVHLFDLDHLLG